MTLLGSFYVKKVQEAIERFRSITFEEFSSLNPEDRGFMGGAIMGNYSAHHPKEAFHFLQCLMNKNGDGDKPTT